MTCVRASRAHGSLGFFSASSKNFSGSGSTRAAACFRSSSVVAFQCACPASPASLRSARYCSAGATGLSWVAAIDRLRTRTRIPPMMRSSGDYGQCVSFGHSIRDSTRTDQFQGVSRVGVVARGVSDLSAQRLSRTARVVRVHAVLELQRAEVGGNPLPDTGSCTALSRRVVRRGILGPVHAVAALSWVERANRPAPEVPMQAHQTTHLLRQVRYWLAVQDLDALADPDLLDRFRRERNEAAFAVLLERHGPLVLRVCGRLLDDGHAVEDAFQATFLALAC